MKIIFELSHPKHYYQFRILFMKLSELGHRTQYLVREKDILLKILNENNEKYELVSRSKYGITGRIFSFPISFHKYLKICKIYDPNVILSKASPFAIIAGKILRCKTVIFPDSEVVRLTNLFVAPLSNLIITPNCFSLNFGKKHHRIPGLFENCYLDQDLFEPSVSVLNLLNIRLPFIVFRFVSWEASHDINKTGLGIREKRLLVETFKNKYSIYISSEKPLPPEFRMYSLDSSPSQIHHILSFATLFIGDSQTMATEAALLGTPSIRINSFVGKNDMSNFKMLERKYNLICNFNNFDNALMKAKEILADPDSKKDWYTKKIRYFKDCGDVNKSCLEILMSSTI